MSRERDQAAGIHIRQAGEGDYFAIVDLLDRLDLMTEAVLALGTIYWRADDEQGTLLAVAGIELGFEGTALLRSVAVEPAFQRLGVGRRLLAHIFNACRNAGISTVYCFSMGAVSYWQGWGFYEVPVGEIATVLPLSPQVQIYARYGELPDEIAWRKDLL